MKAGLILRTTGATHTEPRSEDDRFGQASRATRVAFFLRVRYSVVKELHVTTMALNIRNAEAERLAAEVSRLTGETKTEAVSRALKDRLDRLRREKSRRRLADELDAIAQHCAQLPVRDSRTADEILGYDERGLPG